MPLRAPVGPVDLLEIFKAAGYTLIDEGMDNWVVAKGPRGVPFLIPKNGKNLSRDIVGEACSFDSEIEQAIADFLTDGGQPTATPGTQPQRP
jgi:hypothetical protein